MPVEASLSLALEPTLQLAGASRPAGWAWLSPEGADFAAALVDWPARRYAVDCLKEELL